LVWCYFPYPHSGRWQRHPCLVLITGTDESGNPYLGVAGGTTLREKNHNLRRLSSHEFAVFETDAEFKATHLDHATKFGFSPDHIAVLRFSNEHFWVPNGSLSPKFGRLDVNTERIKARMKDASAGVGLRETLEAKKAAYNKK